MSIKNKYFLMLRQMLLWIVIRPVYTWKVKTRSWKIVDSPVVTSQGRMARASRRLRVIGRGYCKLRATNRLLARLLRTRRYLKRRAGRGSCSYGPRRPGKIQINQSMPRSLKYFYERSCWNYAKKINRRYRY